MLTDLPNSVHGMLGLFSRWLCFIFGVQFLCFGFSKRASNVVLNAFTFPSGVCRLIISIHIQC